MVSNSHVASIVQELQNNNIVVVDHEDWSDHSDALISLKKIDIQIGFYADKIFYSLWRWDSRCDMPLYVQFAEFSDSQRLVQYLLSLNCNEAQ